MAISVTQNHSWLGHNAVRNYPLTRQSSGLSDDGLFNLANNVFASLYLYVADRNDIDRSRFYISRLSNGGGSLRFEVSYFPAGGSSETVAVATATTANIRENHGWFEFDPKANWPEATGFGLLSEFPIEQNLPLGDFEFQFEATNLEPDCIRVASAFVSAIQVVDGPQESIAVSGSVSLRAGENFYVKENISETGEVTLELGAADLDQSSQLCKCDGNDNPVSVINFLAPGEDGNIDLVGLKCAGVTAGNTLLLESTCGEPCCSCDQIGPVIDVLTPIRERTAEVERWLDDVDNSIDRMSDDLTGSESSSPNLTTTTTQLPPTTTTTSADPVTTTTSADPVTTTTTVPGPTTTTSIETGICDPMAFNCFYRWWPGRNEWELVLDNCFESTGDPDCRCQPADTVDIVPYEPWLPTNISLLCFKHGIPVTTTTTVPGPTTTTVPGPTTTTVPEPATTTTVPEPTTTTTVPEPTTTTTVQFNQLFFPDNDLLVAAEPNGIYCVRKDNWPQPFRLFKSGLRADGLAVCPLNEEIAFVDLTAVPGLPSNNTFAKVTVFDFYGRIKRTIEYPQIQENGVYDLAYDQDTGELFVLGDAAIHRIAPGATSATRDTRLRSLFGYGAFTAMSDATVGGALLLANATAAYVVDLDDWDGTIDSLQQVATIPHTLDNPDAQSVIVAVVDPSAAVRAHLLAGTTGAMYITDEIGDGPEIATNLDYSSVPGELFSKIHLTTNGSRYVYGGNNRTGDSQYLFRLDLLETNTDKANPEFIHNTAGKIRVKKIAAKRQTAVNKDLTSLPHLPTQFTYHEFSPGDSSLVRPSWYYGDSPNGVGVVYSGFQNWGARQFDNSDLFTALTVQWSIETHRLILRGDSFPPAVDGSTDPYFHIEVDSSWTGEFSSGGTIQDSPKYILQANDQIVFDLGSNIDGNSYRYVPGPVDLVLMSTDDTYDGMELTSVVSEPPYAPILGPGGESIPTKLKFTAAIPPESPIGQQFGTNHRPSYSPNDVPVSNGVHTWGVHSNKETSLPIGGGQQGIRKDLHYVTSLSAHSSGRTLVTVSRTPLQSPVRYRSGDLVWLRGDTTGIANKVGVVDNDDPSIADNQFILRLPFSEVSGGTPRYATLVEAWRNNLIAWHKDARFLTNWLGDRRYPLRHEFSVSIYPAADSNLSAGFMCFAYNNGAIAIGAQPIQFRCLAVRPVVTREVNAQSDVVDRLYIELHSGVVNRFDNSFSGGRDGRIIAQEIIPPVLGGPPAPSSAFDIQLCKIWIRQDLLNGNRAYGLSMVTSEEEIAFSDSGSLFPGNYFGIFNTSPDGVMGCEDYLVRTDRDGIIPGSSPYGHALA